MEAIRTNRLLLRALQEDDWRAVHRYASDPEVVRYENWGPNTEDETRSFIQRSVSGRKEVPRRDYSLAILLETESELIGSCGIYLTDSGNREGHIGYTLNRKFWRQGYGTETAKALLEFGFGELNLHRIFATCDQANVASVHILEKVGMRREGHLRENKWIRGEWRDSLLYAILDYEWKRSGI
jgi:ribosomal-protein-alanine N-acetyltransferase